MNLYLISILLSLSNTEVLNNVKILEENQLIPKQMADNFYSVLNTQSENTEKILFLLEKQEKLVEKRLYPSESLENSIDLRVDAILF